MGGDHDINSPSNRSIPRHIATNMPDLNQAKHGQDQVRASDRGSHDRSRGEEILSIIQIFDVLRRRRALIVGLMVLSTGASVVVALTRPTIYTSSAVFLPEIVDAERGGALSLARQLGVSVGGQDIRRTPSFYADLVTSVEVLRKTVTKSYARSQIDEGSRETDLVTYYEVKGRTEAQRIQRAVRRLREALSVGTDRETGVVRFSVATSDAQLSQGVAQSILSLVQNFDLATRQSQAGAERRFSGERQAEMTWELREAEDSLKSFLIENRLFNNSPALQFEHDRLQRSVTMRQELVTSIAQVYERARIEEVRNTPVITLIDPPRVPALPNSKRRRLIVVVGIFLGMMSGTFAAFLMNSIDQARSMASTDFTA